MPPPRLGFVDTLRWLCITQVVFVHAAVTYSGIGSWYYYEGGRLGPVTLFSFVFYLTHMQAFFMGLLFFLAGYFVPGAYDRKGPWRFLRDRAVRLGIPTLIYAFLIQPATVYYLLGWVSEHPWPSLGEVARSYYLEWRFLGGTGPMWFTLALLIFSGAYAVVRRRAGTQGPASGVGALLTHRAVALGVVGLAAVTFLVRCVQPIGTAVFNLQLCFFPQYVLLFILGTVAARRQWLQRIPREFGVRWWVLALTLGPLLWLGMILGGGAVQEGFDKYRGGWHAQSAVYCLWESLFCVGACLGSIVLFRERFNRPGRFARFLSDNAFSVYLFHAPIVIALALALRPVALPPLLKWLLLGTLALGVGFAASHLVLRRVPGLKRVL